LPSTHRCVQYEHEKQSSAAVRESRREKDSFPTNPKTKKRSGAQGCKCKVEEMARTQKGRWQMRNQKQTGCIFIKRNSWALRWRETIRTTDGEKRVMRFRLLGDVTPEHKRSKDRTTGKLRIPDDIQASADEILGVANSKRGVSALLTIGEFVTEYLSDRKNSLTRDTHKGYEQLWKQYLSPRVASRVLREFERPDAYTLWQHIAKANPSLSRQTMSHIRFFMSGVFNAALNRGLYKGENPALADLPSGLRGRGVTEAYTVAEVSNLLKLFVGQLKAQAVLAFAWGSGVRRSELSAVKWDHYEQTDAGAVVHICQSNVRGTISKPKTKASADDVHIDAEICRYIDAYRKAVGNPKAGFMFGHVPEKPLNVDSFTRRVILPALTAAKYKWKGWHAFRRGNATFLAQQSTGDGMRSASLMLRHSDEGVTEDHYVKVSKQERRVLKARKSVVITEQRQSAAAQIGAGLKQSVTN
jgi:integrase